jgi:hypothetical protein
MVLVRWQYRRNRKRGRGATDGHSAGREHGLVCLQAECAADQSSDYNRRHDASQDQGHDRPTQARYIAHRYSQTEQRDPDAQNITACKVPSWSLTNRTASAMVALRSKPGIATRTVSIVLVINDLFCSGNPRRGQ